MINQQQILISIILPTYNHAKFLKKAIKSVIKQSYVHWELIIIDNNSTDGTFELVNSFLDHRIRYIKIHNNGIIAASRNAGISLSSGSWIAFLDSDDWWTPDKLIECTMRINKVNPDLIYHDLFLVDKPNQNNFKKFARSRNLYTPIYEDLLLHGNGILNSSVLLRKELLTDIGLLSCDKEKITWEDYDCWLRLSQKTEKFLYINKPLGYYWAAGGNMTNPDRDLVNAKSIYNIYIREQFSIIPSWILFSEAKALIKKGLKKDGIAKLNCINVINYSILDFIKSRVIILVALLNN